jgi:hypothetical protein
MVPTKVPFIVNFEVSIWMSYEAAPVETLFEGPSINPPYDEPSVILTLTPAEPAPSSVRVLDQLIQQAVEAFKSSNTWGDFVGKYWDTAGEIPPDTKHLQHCVTHTLDTL